MQRVPSQLRRGVRRAVEDTAAGRFAYKAYLLGAHYPGSAIRRPLSALRFLFADPKCTNFTYEIANTDELVGFIAGTLVADRGEVQRYADELRTDRVLADRLGQRLATRRDRKSVPLYGRRLGWYCVARIRKPGLIVETGVADGLGAAVLQRAVDRNADEGHPGHVVGIDRDPRAGWLLSGQPRHKLLVSDSLAALPSVVAGQSLGLFIHDSDHHYEHELAEYRLIKDHLASDAVILSDNAHVVPALRDFASAEGWRYAFFKERPFRHFSDGAGIGLATRT